MMSIFASDSSWASFVLGRRYCWSLHQMSSYTGTSLALATVLQTPSSLLHRANIPCFPCRVMANLSQSSSLSDPRPNNDPPAEPSSLCASLQISSPPAPAFDPFYASTTWRHDWGAGGVAFDATVVSRNSLWWIPDLPCSRSHLSFTSASIQSNVPTPWSSYPRCAQHS